MTGGEDNPSGPELDDGIEPEDPSDGDDRFGFGVDVPIVTADDDASTPTARSDTESAPTRSGTIPHHPVATLIALASGRGGAGKSLLAANMAVYLAQLGKRVVAVDADPAGGTLNHMLGTTRPGRGFGSFLRGRADSLDELAVDTPVAGVRLVSGEALAFGSPRPKANGKHVLAALRALSADTVVVDLGPADSPLCLDVWLGADIPIVMTLADPASIECTYRFIKSAFLRRLRGERGLDKLQTQLGRPIPAALDLYRVALELGRSGRDDDSPQLSMEPALAMRPATNKGTKVNGKVPAMAATLAHSMATFRPRFVVSQTRSLGDTKLGTHMSSAAHRRLGHTFEYLGHVESDETVAAAGRRHRPVMAEFPEAKICKNIERILRRVLSAEAERPPTSTANAAMPHLEEEQTFYEVLETEPGVSDEEIRRAYRLFKEIYASGSPVIAGLYEEAELAALHERATAAHDTLFAPERRRLYDLSLPEADLARAVRRAAQTPRSEGVAAAESAAAARSDGADLAGQGGIGIGIGIDAGTEMTGSVLRRVREARGLELSDLAQRTKISERYLRSIEDERFDELPAPVYVRGFVTQIARLLRLDAVRVADGYLRRFHRANGPSAGSPSLKEV